MRLFVDPGANDFGACLYAPHVGQFRVFAASLIRNKVKPEASPIARGAGALQGVMDWLVSKGVTPSSVEAMLVEMPFVYPKGKTKNPNSVMLTAAMAGAFAAFGLGTRKAESVYPADWKGRANGDAFIRNTIKPAVRPEELSAIDVTCAPSYQHNVWDAVGLALWWDGRLKPKRVYYGAVD